MNVIDTAQPDSRPLPCVTSTARGCEATPPRLAPPGSAPTPDGVALDLDGDPWDMAVPALADALLALDPALLAEDGRPTELPPPPPWNELSASLQTMADLYGAVSPTLDPHSRTAARRFIAALRTVADTVSPRGLPGSSTEALWTVLATLRGEPSPLVLRRLGARAADVEAVWEPLRAMLVDLEHVDLDVVERVLARAAPLVVAARARPSRGPRGAAPLAASSAAAAAEYTGDGVMITLRSRAGEVVSTFGRSAAARRARPLSVLLPPATDPTSPPLDATQRARRPRPEVDHDHGQATLFDALGVTGAPDMPDWPRRRAERRAALRSLAGVEPTTPPSVEDHCADTRAWLRRVERAPALARLRSATRLAVDLAAYVPADFDALLGAPARRALVDVELVLQDQGSPSLLAVSLNDVATESRARRAASSLREPIGAWRGALQTALGAADLQVELCFPLVPLTVRL